MTARAPAPAPRLELGIDKATFTRLAGEYRRRWSVRLCAVRPDGSVAMTDGPASVGHGPAARPFRQLALEEALRWGEPTVQMAGDGLLLWGVPLMCNSRVLGGLVAAGPESRLFPAEADRPALDFRAACADLRRLAEEANLTNAALLATHRERSQRERERAEAIHSVKSYPTRGLQQLYLLDEPALIAAIRRGDRPEARGILNRLLLAIHQHAGDRLDLTKSFFMELVVTLTRIAVESGGDPHELLGANFARIAELSGIESEEVLAPWLHSMLEHLMDVIEHSRGRSTTAVLAAALRHMADNLDHDLSRDDVARHVHLSRAHFSRLFKRRLGQTFSQVLTHMRVDRACERLQATDDSALDIALDCGFSDPSYFTKVFRRYTGQTPRQYRKTHTDKG